MLALDREIARPQVLSSDSGAFERPSVALMSTRPTLLDAALVRREPTRPPAFQINGFEEQFDRDTLFYDAFFSADGTQVVALGPPLLNLRPLLERSRIVALPAGTDCSFRLRELDRHGQLWIAVPRGTRRLAIGNELGRFEIVPRPNAGADFAGKRVLFTLSKNNRLEWIKDWIRYHRDIHGANAVLLYDNASTRYRPAKLARALGELAGIEAACVVRWPFKYGPQGLDAKRFWDSDFCQNGAWEHARWCFLGAARSVLNADIDELVVARRQESVFEAAERSPFGVVRYRGAWVPGIAGTTRLATDGMPIRHRDFQHVLEPRRVRRLGLMATYEDRCPPKWAVVPRRCPGAAQWCAHNIKRWLGALPITAAFEYRHFREINDNWKYDRSGRASLDPRRHVRDDVLEANFARMRWDV
jgi:hypothetical protein